MKKKIVSVVCAFGVLLGLTACTSSQSYSITVAGGDKVVMEADTSGGYSMRMLSDKVGFNINKDDERIAQLVVLAEDAIEEQLELADEGAALEVAETGSGYAYVQVSEDEWDYISRLEKGYGFIVAAEDLDTLKDVVPRINLDIE